MTDEEEFVMVVAQLLVPRAALHTTAHTVKNVLTLVVDGCVEVTVEASDESGSYRA